MRVNPENGFDRGRALANMRFASVNEDPAPHYWQPHDCSYWSLVKPIGGNLENLVRNPSFERNLDGWGTDYVGITLSRLTTGVIGGYSLRASPAPGSGGYTVVYGAGQGFSSPFPSVEVATNATMYACVWVREYRGSTVTVSLIHDGVTSPIYPFLGEGQRVSIVAMGGGQWQKVCVSYSAIPRFPTGAPSTPVALRIETDNFRGGTLDVDGAIMTQNIQADYFDGDSGPGFSWSGTPHASTSLASQFSRTYGVTTNFVDLGLDMFADAGWGMPPVENLVTSFAQLNGAHFQRQRLLPRTLTFTASINACCSVTAVSKARKEIIDALIYRFDEICTEELLLIYQMRSECCGALSTPVGIRCSYQTGLEGLRNNPYFEKITLQFIANNDPTFFDLIEDAAILSNVNLVGTSIVPTGNAAMYPIIELRAGASPVQINRVINDVPSYTLALGNPTVGYTLPANNYLIIDTDPRSFNATLYPANTSVLSQINYPLSNMVGKSMMLTRFNSWRAEWGATNPGDQELLIRWKNRFLSADSLTFDGGCGVCCSSGSV